MSIVQVERIVKFLCMIAMTSRLCQAQTNQPDWVAELGKSARFPQSRFFTGFGISTSSDNALTGEKIEQAKNSARSSLVESMKVRVQVRKSGATAVRSTGGGEGELHDDYQSNIESTSDIDIEGVEFEVYYSKAYQPVYALAYIDKEKVGQKYRRELESRLSHIEELQKQGKDFFDQGDIIAVRELDDNCRTILDEIDKIIATMEIIGETAFPPSLTDVKARALRAHRLVAGLWESDRSEGRLQAQVWTDAGGGKVRLRQGDAVTVYIRVNKPCYLHLVCRLSAGALVIPDYRYWNFYFDENSVNKDLALPDVFIVTPPLGTDTLQAIVSEGQWPRCEYIPSVFEGEDYLAIPQSFVAVHSTLFDGDSSEISIRSISISTYR